MVLERELKFSVSKKFVLPAFDNLRADLSATILEPQTLDTVYFDTADLRLARWGYSLRHRAGEGWTIKRPAVPSGALLTRDEITFAEVDTEPPPEALRLLRVYIRHAALEPVATLATVRRRVRIQTGAGLTAAEVVDDDVRVQNDGIRFHEIEVELGPAADDHLLATLVRQLSTAGAGALDPTPKHVRALAGRLPAPPEVAPRPLSGKLTAADVIQHAIAGAVTTLFRHDPGIRLGDDPEDIHQARVAIRRLRSDLRTFSSLLDATWRNGLRGELRWLGTELGAVRDIDVLLNRLQRQLQQLPSEDLSAANHLVESLQEEGVQARQALRGAMDGERYLALVEQLIAAANTPALLPAATKRAAPLLPRLVSGPWRRLRKAVAALPVDPSVSELHRVRILAKRCRYAAEAVVPAVGKRASRFAWAVAQLQGALGEHQDSARLQVWLRRRVTSPDVTLVAGELLAMERAAADELATGWWKTWRTLDRKISRSWLP